VQVDLVDLLQRDLEHLANAALGRPRAGRRQIENLEHQHVAAVAAAPLEQAAGGGAAPDGRDDLEERVAQREHRVAQAEPIHTGIYERLAQPELGPQCVRHRLELARGQHSLSEPRQRQRAGETEPTRDA
jgi:hypothetical protein